MNGKQRVLAGLVGIVAMSVWTSAQQPQGNDEPAIKREVNAFMDQDRELFSAGRIDQLVERIYHPSGQLSNQGHSSIEQLKAAFPSSRKALLAAGYGRSQMPVRNVCILGATVAVVSGRGFRYLADGRVMGEYRWDGTR